MITKTIDTHAPIKKLSRKQGRLKTKPWITKGLLTSIKRKQKLHKSHFINGSAIAKNYYKVYSNTLTKIKNFARKLYYYHKLNEYKNNSQKTWKTLRTLLPSKNNSLTSNLLTVSNLPISDLNEIAEEFNHYFSSVGKSVAASLKQSNDVNIDEMLYLKNPCLNSIYLQPTTPHEIMQQINALKLNKVRGHDDIVVHFLKVDAPVLAHPLSIMLNRCLTLGVFPNKL